MDINPELIKSIIYIIIIIAIVLFLIKKAIKVAVSIFVIFLLFNVGFIMTGQDINETFKLDEVLDKDASTTIQSFFDDFDKKREEFGIVDAKKVEEKMKEGIEKGTEIIIKGLGSVDIDAFAKNLSEKIYEIGAENINMDELSNEIKKQLDGISEEDVNKIINKIIEYSSDLKEKANIENNQTIE